MTGDQRVIPYFIARSGVAHGDVPTDVEPAFPPLCSFIFSFSVASSCTFVMQVHSRAYFLTAWPPLAPPTTLHLSGHRASPQPCHRSRVRQQGASLSILPSDASRTWMFTGPNVLSNACIRGRKGVCSIFRDFAHPRPTPWTLWWFRVLLNDGICF